jgi:AraC-like DNA-binding protein
MASAMTLLVKTSERKPSPQLSDAQARRLVEHIHANLDCDLTLFDLSKIVHFSPRQFVRLFSNTFGKTPRQYIINERVARAKDLLSQGRLLVEIATTLGFSSQSHFSGTFRKMTGMSPGRFKRQLPARLRNANDALPTVGAVGRKLLQPKPLPWDQVQPYVVNVGALDEHRDGRSRKWLRRTSNSPGQEEGRHS